tara:strand:+ start:611 stop:3079 length:2469 start_codon:yes stop_codon:yes gene_type:complete
MPELFGLGGSSTNINYPAQPSYGEGMRDALKAQVELLQGTGDFAGTGSLESLLPLEESIRKKTAQTDTDVLRQTLLGGDATYNKDGKILEGYTDADGKTIEAKPRPVFAQYGTSGPGVNTGSAYLLKPNSNYDGRSKPTSDQILYEYNIDGKSLTPSVKKEFFNKLLEEGYIDKSQNKALLAQADNPDLKSKGLGDHIAPQEKLVIPEDAQPIFKKDSAGNEIVRPDLANTTQRTGDGMVDLLGDSRNVTGQKQDFAQYVKDNADLQEQFQESRRQGDTRTIEEYGQQHYQEFGQAEGRELPTTFGELDRRAGFDAEGNFLGASAYAEDLAAGNLSRQRERDLQDVARLSGTYQDIMEDYKPGTQEALESARQVLEGQKDALTGAGAIDIPTDSTFGGKVGGQTFDAATMGDAINLQAGTTYDPSLVSEKGLGYEAVAGLQGGQLLQNDPVRAALMKDAEVALGQGLTDREQRQIAEAARARSTMMGRTFDQSGAIAEAEARVAEDNQRRMQNRAFAQSALGQEAGFQESDLGRALQAGIQNQAAQNRAGEFTAGQTLASRMANQAASNQASQFGVQAGMGQEQSEAQMNQARLMANQQAQQQASAFGAESAQQGAIQDARNLQQANQFQQSTSADAQRLNEQLKQSGILGYIQAAGGLAALEDQSTLDPFQAVLGRGGGGSLQAGQSVFGQAGYGLNSGPQYLNPESGLGFIQNQATNAANMYNANVAADATKTAGIYSGIGSAIGGLGGGAIAKYCWVAREVYGEHNPAWLLFRKWMLNESPSWFRATYIKYGERFARFISDKPRLKARIRMWMDTKIRR